MSKTTHFPRIVISITALLALILLHIIPLPILEVLFLVVVISRPRWFKNFVDHIYED